MEQKPNNEYFITYSNSFLFEGVLLAFRKQKLFNITNIPIYIAFNEIANCWIVNRKQLTLSKVKELATKREVTVDVSDLQWYEQIKLDKIFHYE
jgi:hypothetical protein